MQKVEVYFNLHSHKWSIRDANTKLVLGHAERVVLFDAKPKVSEAGRLRVLREKRKNVHSFLCGEVVTLSGFESYKGRTVRKLGDWWVNMFTRYYCTFRARCITYNPYKYSSFVFRDSEVKFEGADFAELLSTRDVVILDHMLCKEFV